MAIKTTELIRTSQSKGLDLYAQLIGEKEIINELIH